MLLNDAYAGHRKWWRADWVEDPALANVWTEWDYILVRAVQYIKDYTTASGHLVWIDEDPDVWWDIDTADSGYQLATHEYRENHEIKDWQTLRAVPRWEEDVERPSMEKWLKRLEEDEGKGFDGHPSGGTPRPPTAEELAALRNPERRPEYNSRTW
jgi:hypothetical protein